MIPIVEDLLKQTIDEQLKLIRETPDIIDRMFNFMSQDNKNRFKRYLQDTDIKTVIGFPREPAQLPCYCIILGQEVEEMAGLGETLGGDLFEESVNSGVFLCEVNTCLKEKYVKLPVVPLKDVHYVSYGGNYVDHAIKDYSLGIIEILEDFIEDGDMLEVDADYYELYSDTFGTMFNINYRLECWTDNGDLTSYMYHLLKYILLSSRTHLLKNGLNKPVLVGGDLEPVPEYFPMFVYRRTLNLSALVDNTFDNTQEIIQDIKVQE